MREVFHKGGPGGVRRLTVIEIGGQSGMLMRASGPATRARWSRSPDERSDLWAVREESASGVREHAGFVGDDGERIFSYCHLPSRRPIAGLVICSPLYAEFLHNYRKEVLLARNLARAGFAVQRFHYRGSGNSEGEAGSITLASMIEDALAAVLALRSKAQISNIAFLGTRLGGIVAAAVANRFDDAPLVLWEPVIRPDSYFREAFRAAAVRELRQGSDAKTARDRVTVQELESKGFVDVLGYSVHLTLYRSLISRRFSDELGDKPRDVLLLQLDRQNKLRDEYADVVDELRSSGFDIEARVIHADDHWWFSGNPEHSAQTVRAVVGDTSGWLDARFAAS